MTTSSGIAPGGKPLNQLQQVGPVEGEITTAQEGINEALSSQKSLIEEQSESTSGSVLIKQGQKKLEENKNRFKVPGKEQAESDESTATIPVGRKGEGDAGGDSFQENPHEQAANRFQRANPQVKASALIALRSNIKPGMTPIELMEEIGKLYPQPDLAAEALEFIIQTTTDPTERARLAAILREFEQANAAEIDKGKQIKSIVLQAKIVDPSEIRAIHQNMTHENPKDFAQGYMELTTKFPGKSLKELLKILLQLAGEELRDPKISTADHGRIYNIIKQVRFIQAALGPEKFFEKRWAHLESQMRELGLEIPPQLTPQFMTKVCIELFLQDYPNSRSVLNAANNLLETMSGG